MRSLRMFAIGSSIVVSLESSVGAGGWGGGEMGGWMGGGREKCREGSGWNGERVSEFLLCRDTAKDKS